MPNRLLGTQKLACTLLAISIWSTVQAGTRQQSPEVKPLGCFANVRGDGEHLYGYSLRLWTSDQGIIGIIDYYSGLNGDSPMGVLTDVQYDAATGTISFQAKLTSGLHYCRKHNGIPSHNLLSFRGLFESDRLKGNLILREDLDSPPVIIDNEVVILMSRQACDLDSYGMYEIWRWYWEPALKSRGPKW